MNVQCPHCLHVREVPDTTLHKVDDCPSCRRRFVAKPSGKSPVRRGDSGPGFGGFLLLILVIAAGALGYVCRKQQASPAYLARRFLERLQPQPAIVALRKGSLVGLTAASGEKSPRDPAFVTFDNVTVPVAPTALDTDEIQLTWKNAATNQTGFKIEASTDNALFYEISDLAADATRFVNTGLRHREGLRYRVRAYNTDGYSAYSNPAGLASP